jgi:hypothetical protein
MLGAAVVLHRSLFVLPWIPLLGLRDQDVFLTDASRMLHGQLPYRDFFSPTVPGTQTFYFVLFKLLGVHNWIPGVSMIVIGLGFIYLSKKISESVLSGAWVYIPGLLFLSFSYRMGLDGTHHWFSAFFGTAALAVLLRRRNRKTIAAAAVLCALSAFFTQTRGAMLFIGVLGFLAWESVKDGRGWKRLAGSQLLAIFCFGISLTTLFAYFVAKAGFSKFIWSILVFPVRFGDRYVPYNSPGAYMNSMDFHVEPGWMGMARLLPTLIVLTLIPAIYLFGLVRLQAREDSENRRRLVLLCTFGLSAFAAIAPSASEFRMSIDSLPAFVILTCLAVPSRMGRLIVSGLCVVALVFLIAPFRPKWTAIVALPAGKVAVRSQEDKSEWEWLGKHIRPGDFVLDASERNGYFLLQAQNPVPVPFLTNTEFTRPEQVRDCVSSLRTTKTRFILWSPDELDGWHGERSLGSDHLQPLRDYVRSFRTAVVFSDGTRVLESPSAGTAPEPPR